MECQIQSEKQTNNQAKTQFDLNWNSLNSFCHRRRKTKVGCVKAKIDRWNVAISKFCMHCIRCNPCVQSIGVVFRFVEHMDGKIGQWKRNKEMIWKKDSNLKQFLFARTRSFTPGRVSLIYGNASWYTVYECVLFFALNFCSFRCFDLPIWTKHSYKPKNGVLASLVCA